LINLITMRPVDFDTVEAEHLRVGSRFGECLNNGLDIRLGHGCGCLIAGQIDTRWSHRAGFWVRSITACPCHANMP
jgi:hypothetical protein